MLSNNDKISIMIQTDVIQQQIKHMWKLYHDIIKPELHKCKTRAEVNALIKDIRFGVANSKIDLPSYIVGAMRNYGHKIDPNPMPWHLPLEEDI